MRMWYIMALAAAAPHIGFAAVAPDLCSKLIPPAAVLKLTRSFPEYRLPRASDNLDEDVARSKQNGGSGCLGVAVADFLGTGEPAAAVLLTALKGSGFVVAVALRHANTWQVVEIFREQEGRSRQYIESVSSGHYDHVETYEPDTSKGELEYLDCPYSGFITGATEATGEVYCLVNSRWQHVAVLD